jgi:hypothetical protein
MPTADHRTPRRIRRPVLHALPIAWLLAACASGGTAGPADTPAAAGVPGFDTRTFPGDAVMRQWVEASPYRWVGYYLPAPCHPRSTWAGNRAALAGMGWGFAVLYVGEQDWAAVANPPQGPGATPPGEAPRCTAANLGADRGAADGADAAAAAAAEGFPAGTTVYLNVERVEVVSPALGEYVRGWVRGLTEAGMQPGLYLHARNADALRGSADEAFAAAGGAGRTRLWVARTGGFQLYAAPAAAGVAGTNIWQGLLGVRETWGGAALTIDVNVADSASPSG